MLSMLSMLYASIVVVLVVVVVEAQNTTEVPKRPWNSYCFAENTSLRKVCNHTMADNKAYFRPCPLHKNAYLECKGIGSLAVTDARLCPEPLVYKDEKQACDRDESGATTPSTTQATSTASPSTVSPTTPTTLATPSASPSTVSPTTTVTTPSSSSTTQAPLKKVSTCSDFYKHTNNRKDQCLCNVGVAFLRCNSTSPLNGIEVTNRPGIVEVFNIFDKNLDQIAHANIPKLHITNAPNLERFGGVLERLGVKELAVRSKHFPLRDLTNLPYEGLERLELRDIEDHFWLVREKTVVMWANKEETVYPLLFPNLKHLSIFNCTGDMPVQKGAFEHLPKLMWLEIDLRENTQYFQGDALRLDRPKLILNLYVGEAENKFNAMVELTGVNEARLFQLFLESSKFNKAVLGQAFLGPILKKESITNFVYAGNYGSCNSQDAEGPFCECVPWIQALGGDFLRKNIPRVNIHCCTKSGKASDTLTYIAGECL